MVPRDKAKIQLHSLQSYAASIQISMASLSGCCAISLACRRNSSRARRLAARSFGRICLLFDVGAMPKVYHILRLWRQPASAIHLQRGDKGFLRDVDLAELPHLLLAFLLL